MTIMTMTIMTIPPLSLKIPFFLLFLLVFPKLSIPLQA